MATEAKPDPMIANDEVEIDSCTSAAIERGLRAADDGQVVSADEARRQVGRWISKFSTQNRP
jgi:predicted transcriptional regulator